MGIRGLWPVGKTRRRGGDGGPEDLFRQDVVQLCRVCQARSEPLENAYGRFWFRCPECDFVQAEVCADLYSDLQKGEGFTAGTGVGDGGYREYYLCKLLHDDLGLSTILLYGTGNTPTFTNLMHEGLDVWGCDLSADLIKLRNEAYEGKRFFHPDGFPKGRRYDIIVAVEVFEHFLAPLRSLRLLGRHLAADGVITGTTDFYDGSPITDHVYLKPRLHVAYWSEASLRLAAKQIGLPRVQLFELECPGSVTPDEKFGLLWPRKRVFFLYRNHDHDDYFERLRERHTILPIDRP